MPRLSSSPTRRWLLDLVLLALAGTVFLSGEGGTRSGDPTLHQAVAVGLGAGVTLHLAWQWRWIMSASRRLFTQRSWLRYLVGAALLLAFALTVGSGLAISSWLASAPLPGLVRLHHVAPKLFALLVLVHAGLHWSWIASTAGKVIQAPKEVSSR